MTLEEKQKRMREWRSRKRSQGLCTNCFSRKAGGEGGTKRYCPICAEKRRARYKREMYGYVPCGGVNKMLALSAKMPKISVTMNDLRRQAVC